MLNLVDSEKILGNISQVMEDHCYSRKKCDQKEVDVCVVNDTNSIKQCSSVGKRSEDIKKTITEVRLTTPIQRCGSAG